MEAVKSGKVSEENLNNLVDRIIDITMKCKERKIKQYNKDEHHNIALEIAKESIVLLKNEDNILPLNVNNKIGLIGDMARNPRYQGAGSSTINLYKLDSTYETLERQGIEFQYAQGYERIECKNDTNLLEEAIRVAKNNEIVLLYVGLTENYESEGIDRVTMDLPENQTKLIEEICKVNDNVIVVLSHGAPITMPWKDNLKAIITGYLGGEAGAKAMVDTLLGNSNPSGKLAESYPIRIEDVSSYNNFPGNEVNVAYKESIYVGYRYFDKKNIEVQYPFGYGLSYTNYKYDNISIKKKEDKYIVSFKIKNIGNYKGKEIAQIYITKENSKIFRAPKELKAFEKVELNIGEEKEVNIVIDKSAFEYYDVKLHRWNIEDGEYQIQVGKSSRNIVLKEKVYVEGDKDIIEQEIPEKYFCGDIKDVTDEEFEKVLGYKIPNKKINLKDITEENTIEQLKNTKVGKEIYDSEVIRMNKLLNEQNVNKATKVMMDLQKPLKKFYEKKGGKYTKEMIDKFIDMAKNNEEPNESEFIKRYLNLC